MITWSDLPAVDRELLAARKTLQGEFAKYERMLRAVELAEKVIEDFKRRELHFWLRRQEQQFTYIGRIFIANMCEQRKKELMDSANGVLIYIQEQIKYLK